MKKAVLIISVIFLFAINPYTLQAQTKAEVLAYIAGMKNCEVVNIEWGDDHSGGHSVVNLHNLRGSLIRKESFSGNSYQLDISDLQSGIFILNVETKNRKTTRKICTGSVWIK